LVGGLKLAMKPWSEFDPLTGAMVMMATPMLGRNICSPHMSNLINEV